jgi:hypothetical protein
MVELTAEWALWGMRAEDTQYHLLEHSGATLTGPDFVRHIERYASGTADRLPQYTIGWVPGQGGAPEFVTVAIHEHAPYRLAPPGNGGRSRSRYDALGREIVFIRLFCVRFADLAEHMVSYAELLGSVRQHELPPPTSGAGTPDRQRDGSWPTTTIRIPPRQPVPADDGPAGPLAAAVAARLLTAPTAQVCVLGADVVTADERVAFIDSVLSLLPYGMRATLSASTWASPTAQDLKLRLFFASAPRDDRNTRHVRWADPGLAGTETLDSEPARLYLDWVLRAGPRARSLVAGQTAPLRFSDADIRQMVAALPRDLTVTDTIEDLAASLAEGNSAAVQAEAKRLRQHLGDPLTPADRDRYRRQIAALGLLRDQWTVDAGTRLDVYQVLFGLAFETPLTYAGYCEIEDQSGGPLPAELRHSMLGLGFATFVPWLLTARAEPRFGAEALFEGAARQEVAPEDLLTMLQMDAEAIRPAHRPALYDFGVQYLRARAKDARGELAQRGYLTETLETSFPGDQRAQLIRLEDTLRFVHGESLNRGQIRELFAAPQLHPTAAFEAALKRLASSPKTAQFVTEQATYARLRYAAHVDESQTVRRGRRWGRRTRGA